MNAHENFEIFKKRYLLEKRRPFYTGASREFVAETIRNGTVNTELILCQSGVKPVSRFIAEKPADIEFLGKWAEDNGLAFLSRDLRTKESANNLNPRIRYVVYFSKNADLLRIIGESDRTNGPDNEITVGKLLWYPDCCNLAWSKKGEIGQIRDTVEFFFDEYVTDAAPINNPFFNFIDRSLTFFYPCRLRCEAAKERHEVFAKTLRESGYGDFVDETERLFASPVLLLGPKNPEALTLPLHFDEIFRIHFIGKRIGESVVAYADFFLTSLSFLDQKADSEYARNCLRVLDAALAWDNVRITESEFSIRKGNAVVGSFGKDFSRFRFFP